MTEPTRIAPANLFKFIGRAPLAVILISVHRRHTFNRALRKRLRREHPGMAFGIVDLRDLMLAGGPALRFLHQGLRLCGAPVAMGVVPGYVLFRGGEILAWDGGLPTYDDVEALARSGLLGVIWSGLTRDMRFLRQALQVATEQVAAQRIAARFAHAIAAGAEGRAAGRSTAPPKRDVYWAYQILGVLPTATDREVHAAWRRRRMETHPDRAADDPAEFARRGALSAEINLARDIILNHRRGGGNGERYARGA